MAKEILLNNALMETLLFESSKDCEALLSNLCGRISANPKYKVEFKVIKTKKANLWIINNGYQLSKAVRYENDKFFVAYGHNSDNIFICYDDKEYKASVEELDIEWYKELLNWLLLAPGNTPKRSESIHNYSGKKNIIYDNNTYRILVEA